MTYQLSFSLKKSGKDAISLQYGSMKTYPPSFEIEKIGKGKYSYTKQDKTVVTGTQQQVIDEALKDVALKEATKLTNDYNKYVISTNSNLGQQANSPEAQKLIDEANKKVDTIKDALLKDDVKIPEKTSGRLAIILGFDGIRLNKSYQPNNYALALNRSKIIVQENALDNGNLLKEARGTL